MWKKRMLCLVLILCAIMLASCQKKEVFSTTVPNQPQENQPEEAVSDIGQNIYAEPVQDFDDGSYNPASEEGGEWEDVFDTDASATQTPVIQSEYAGATPVLIDPVDKPTPTPLPPLSFSYETYTATTLKMTFEAPSGWIVDESASDTYILINPMPMDYAATMTVRCVPVNKQYTKSELTKEIKGMLETIGSEGFKNYDPSQTAERSFLGNSGIYANYKGTLHDGTKVAGRIIATCVNKNLYMLHVSYPQGYTETYVSKVFDKFRHTVKLVD